MIQLVSRERVIRHPLLVGFGWAAVTVPLTAAIMALTGLKALELHYFGRVAALVAVAGPAFGYLVRWAYLREDARAR